jgi:hypothetical protein
MLCGPEALRLQHQTTRFPIELLSRPIIGSYELVLWPQGWFPGDRAQTVVCAGLCVEFG